MANEALTPMMKQFKDLKAKHPDAILLFRCGDFYETYLDDAVVASRILGITLTRRNNGKSSSPTEMAGFPYHALDTYLPRLIRAGHRVAICDQLEDPKLTKKLVKRGITELVTPGVALSDNVLTARENNFLSAVHFGKSDVGLAFLDISTGEFLVAEGTPEYADKLLSNFAPKEILVARGTRGRLESLFGTKPFVFELDDWAFTESTARDKLLHHFAVNSLKGFGVHHMKSAVTAAGAVMCYLDVTQHTRTAHITSLRRIDEGRYVRIDRATARNLELIVPMNEGGRSLLDVIDHTRTPMGARLLRRWLLFPLRSVADITTRQEGVEQFLRQPQFGDLAQAELDRIGDLERIVSKVSVGRANPRDMQQLRLALEGVAALRQACLQTDHPTMLRIGGEMDDCSELHDRILRELLPDPPAVTAKGGVIAGGVSPELDELRAISTSGKDYLLQLQQRESAATGIPSLKIGFNNVFGYYIEVRNTHKDRVPAEWVRKQTLAQAERYITPELKDYEERILTAEDRILALETQLFADLLQAAAGFIAPLQSNATALSTLDCLLSFATAARSHRYVRPIVDETTDLDIRQGRHPVIETLMPPGETYVPNDVSLDTHTQQIIIITGPNMAGKSALLRQTALIAILAQTGSFVPADSARIGLIDTVFTRVGASDNISVGESTFMVEMSEAASILNNLTPRSLVLFDELGRGTSTYDGISIAWAVAEYIHENGAAPARTLFATHYHELNEMARLFPRIKNWNVSVMERDGRIVFLRTLRPGGAEHSFGIHVARLAGMPAAIVRRAEHILAELEAGNARTLTTDSPAHPENCLAEPAAQQLNFFQLDDPVLQQIRDEILHLDVNNLTPIEALNKLNDIKKIVGGN